MKPYTKTGDCGLTSLASNQRVSKTCTRIEAYGTVDELNSQVGLLITYCKDTHDTAILTEVQETLFLIGGILATDSPGKVSTVYRSTDEPCITQPMNRASVERQTANHSEYEISLVTSDMVFHLEQEIDAICTTLPPLKSFILPGGSRSSAICHVCRTVCRRAERRILALHEQENSVNPNIIAYINRLSDYFFVLARKLNQDENHPEILWRK